MKKVYAVWEGERKCRYITPGKKYKVLSCTGSDFTTICDEGDIINCLWEGCPHIDDCDWTRIEENDEAPHTEQKTLRDEFAMAALIGLLASVSRDSRENFAVSCYKMADAMLEARKK